jgi:CO dehydrogenase maturation factor
LVTHVVLGRDEVVIMDMEAGIEHLGRATAQAVDKLIVVVEPGRRSIDTAEHIRRLASEIHLNQVAVVGNKIRSPKDEEFLRKHLSDFDFLGFMPYDDDAHRSGPFRQSPYESATSARQVVAGIITNYSPLDFHDESTPKRSTGGRRRYPSRKRYHGKRKDRTERRSPPVRIPS